MASFPMSDLASDSIVRAVQRLGYRAPKKEQLEIITGFLNGRDVFGVLPTGFGKSLCYACLPVLFDELNCKFSTSSEPSIIVVVTPLVAIMKDQVYEYIYLINTLYIK